MLCCEGNSCTESGPEGVEGRESYVTLRRPCGVMSVMWREGGVPCAAMLLLWCFVACVVASVVLCCITIQRHRPPSKANCTNQKENSYRRYQKNHGEWEGFFRLSF